MKTDGIPEDYPDSVCLFGQGALCCSFLMIGPKGLCCAKLTGFEPALRARREAKTMTALGNNCAGPPDFTPFTGLVS